jgi:hypothetical protein
MASRKAWPLFIVAALLCTTAVVAEVRFTPHLGLQEILNVASTDDDQVYAEVSAGFDATIKRHRVNARIAYDYGRRFAEHGDVDTQSRHSLTARGTAEIIKGWLSVDAGAYAGLFNRDPRAGVSQSVNASNANLTQTFSGFVEPRFRREIGEIGVLDASFRLGAASAGGQSSSTGGAGGGIGLPGDQTPIDRTAHSVSQEARLTFSNQDNGRFRWTAAAEATREDSQRLAQLYRTYRGAIEAQYRITRQFGLVVTGGYEDILNTEQAFLADATGRPIPDAAGDFQIDPLNPRRVVFARSGLTYEAGFIWTPSRRNSLRLRYGKSDGGNNLNGEAQFKLNSRLGLTATLQQGIESFGRLLTQDIAGIPTSFIINDRQAAGLGDCVIGVDPSTGRCIANATQAISSAQFRNQSAQLIVAGSKHRVSYSLTAIYNRRRFFDPQQLQTPTGPLVDPTLAQRTDQSLSLNGNIRRRIGRDSTISLTAFAQRYQFALAGSRDDNYFGGTIAYSKRLGRQLELNLTANGDRRFTKGAPDTKRAVVTLGIRAHF